LSAAITFGLPFIWWDSSTLVGQPDFACQLIPKIVDKRTFKIVKYKLLISEYWYFV